MPTTTKVKLAVSMKEPLFEDPGAPHQWFIEKMRSGYCVVQSISVSMENGVYKFAADGTMLNQPVRQLTKSPNLERELDELIALYGLDTVGALVSERILQEGK